MLWLLIPLVVILAAPVVVGAFFAAVKGDPPPYEPDDWTDDRSSWPDDAA